MHTDREQADNMLYACPCCGYATIGEPAEFEICEICFWEDDGQDDPDSEQCLGGPNQTSLDEARFNFLVFGAASKKEQCYCRAPNESDINLRNYYLEYRIVSKNAL